MAGVITRSSVVDALQEVSLPGLTRSIVSFGFVKELDVDGGDVRVGIRFISGREGVGQAVREAAEKALHGLPGVTNVQVDVRVDPPPDRTPASSGDRNDPLSGVRFKIAVASGKGGVGKSTVSVNLACSLAALGWSVGLFDADIYGPSQQVMLGIPDARPVVGDDKKIIPAEAHGVRVVSFGFFAGSDTPVIWRGPMVMKAIDQFIRDVAWGELDIVVIDLPPGTGDVQLTLCQTLPLDGAIIVTTPQDVALIDARKGLQMFRKLEIPILGIVENMSTFTCPHCGESTPIFRRGGGSSTAEELNVPLLAEIPIDASLPVSGDEGTPIVAADPGSPVAETFAALTRRVAADLATR